MAVAFLDLLKTFDSISHKILQKKLISLNFDENTITMMDTYLTEKHQKETLSVCDSEWVQLYQGVPQGTALGPLLFNIYVNDMQHTVTENCSQ